MKPRTTKRAALDDAARPLTFGSLFAGAGGFDCGLERVGMRCLWQVEIDKQCRSVLRRHWPDVPQHDDVRRVRAALEPRNAKRTAIRLERPDLLCGGFPCQDISVAGRRGGLAGARSGMWFEFRRIAALLAPRWLLIENVDGLRSSNGGKDLGTILKSLGDMGYWWSYRVCDSQWFGVAQRRERVFIVGHLGAIRGRTFPVDTSVRGLPAEVLFERDCLPWHPAPSRQAREGVARAVASCLNSGGNNGGFRTEPGEHLVAHTLRAEGFDASEDGTGRGTPIVPVAFAQNQRDEVRDLGNCAGALAAEPGMKQQTYVANTFAIQERACSESLTSGPGGKGYQEGIGYTLEARHHVQSVANTQGVRRLTPRECERLQGFPDDWTRYTADGSELADSPRYRMMGNAVTVNVVEWIGHRIVEASRA